MADELPDLGEREAELLRINAELAAEIRALTAGRITSPRAAPGPAARRVSRLHAELEARQAELETAGSEIEHLRRRCAELEWTVADRAQHIDELDREVTRLRSGIGGVLRRARARLLGT